MEYTSKEVYKYVSKHSNDPIVEWKKCRLSWQDFPIYQSDLEFYDKVSPTFEVDEIFAKEFLKKNSDVKEHFEYKDWKLKAKLPTPTLCPEEREAQRYVFRNERCLYRNTCNFSWKTVVSIISPDKNYLVYDSNIRWSDKWTPAFIWKGWINQKFSLIIDDLIHKVPVRSKFGHSNENCDYTATIGNSKDCYMCFGSGVLENCLYSQFSHYSKECVDCYYCEHSEWCYDCVNINNCFWLKHCDGCVNCSNSSYLYKCVWCHDCFNCVNLENKSYCINNKQYTKEEYYDVIKKQKLIPLERKILWMDQKNSENCFWGNLSNCHDCYFVWSWVDCNNVRYTSSEIEWENCYDTFCTSKNCIYTITGRSSDSCGFIVFCRYLTNCRYCINSFNCSNCFWCVGIQNKEYCIYNKEYSKEEYNQIVPEIIAWMIRNNEWWEFFDPQLSYFWYNESMNTDFHPLTKEEALKRWYKRSDYESPAPKVEKFVPWDSLPKVWCKIIQEKKPDFLNKILNYAIVCEITKKPFRIIKQEIEFYIKHDLPLPTKHPDVRHAERFARKDPTTMHLIHCDECGEEMLSVHLPWEWKKVLCEKCYYNEK